MDGQRHPSSPRSPRRLVDHRLVFREGCVFSGPTLQSPHRLVPHRLVFHGTNTSESSSPRPSSPRPFTSSRRPRLRRHGFHGMVKPRTDLLRRNRRPRRPSAGRGGRPPAAREAATHWTFGPIIVRAEQVGHPRPCPIYPSLTLDRIRCVRPLKVSTRFVLLFVSRMHRAHWLAMARNDAT